VNHADCDAPASTIAVAAVRRDEWPEAGDVQRRSGSNCKDNGVANKKHFKLLNYPCIYFPKRSA
jgi:hypothetical protein